MKNNLKHTFYLVLFLTLIQHYSVSAQSVNYSTFGDGLRFIAADSSFSMQIRTRFQVLYQGSGNNNTNWDDRFLIRRSRLKFDGFAYTPRLVYKIELGLSNSDIGSDNPLQTNNSNNIILDAVAKWEVLPNLRLWIGQTKLPGNRERVISSQELQLVDRSLLNAQFNLDRDVGLQLRHEHKAGKAVIREIAAISMGEGRNITVNNSGGYAFTTRVELLPFGAFEDNGDYFASDLAREKTPKLSIAATYDYNNNTPRARGQLGSFLTEERDLSTVFVDAMFKYRGFSMMAEYANREALQGPVVSREPGGEVNQTFVTGNALNVQAGYFFLKDWEVAGRYTDFNPTTATGLNAEQQYTLGLSRFIVGHSLKVQSDVTLQLEQGQPDNYLFRIQMELAL